MTKRDCLVTVHNQAQLPVLGNETSTERKATEQKETVNQQTTPDLKIPSPETKAT